MSVVIVGGNECMTRRYKDLCAEYRCKAKIYPKMSGCLKDIGNPDLLILMRLVKDFFIKIQGLLTPCSISSLSIL